jgi:hypothetical protein
MGGKVQSDPLPPMSQRWGRGYCSNTKQNKKFATKMHYAYSCRPEHILPVRYHCGGWSEEVYSCILISYMVYL